MMNGFDWVLIGISAFCMLRGLFRGAISQVFGIAGILGGFLLALHSYASLAQRLLAVFPNFAGAQPICFIALFALTWFCIAVVGHWTAKLVYGTGLGSFDRFLGGILGVGKAFILASILISVLTIFLPGNSNILTQSVIVPYVKDGTRILLELVPEKFQNDLQEKQKDLDKYMPDRKEPKPKPDLPAKPDVPERKSDDTGEKRGIGI
ncbi:MAG: CvpA family protein [Syntrophobacteraceae bacterium]